MSGERDERHRGSVGLIVAGVAVVALALVAWYVIRQPGTAPTGETVGGQGVPVGLPVTASSPSVAPEISSSDIPALTLADYSGRSVSLHDWHGTPLVLNAWAAWCPYCVQELPDFAAVQEEFGEAVTIVAIDRAEPLNDAKAFTDTLGVTGKLVFLLDPGDTFYQAVGGFSMPETLFYDAAGKLVFHKRGSMDRDEIRQRTGELVKP